MPGFLFEASSFRLDASRCPEMTKARILDRRWRSQQCSACIPLPAVKGAENHNALAHLDLPEELILRIRIKPSLQKYFSFSETQINLYVDRPASTRGTNASSRS
jgi:hypothetical protein